MEGISTNYQNSFTSTGLTSEVEQAKNFLSKNFWKQEEVKQFFLQRANSKWAPYFPELFKAIDNHNLRMEVLIVLSGKIAGSRNYDLQKAWMTSLQEVDYEALSIDHKNWMATFFLDHLPRAIADSQEALAKCLPVLMTFLHKISLEEVKKLLPVFLNSPWESHLEEFLNGFSDTGQQFVLVQQLHVILNNSNVEVHDRERQQLALWRSCTSIDLSELDVSQKALVEEWILDVPEQLLTTDEANRWEQTQIFSIWLATLEISECQTLPSKFYVSKWVQAQGLLNNLKNACVDANARFNILQLLAEHALHKEAPRPLKVAFWDFYASRKCLPISREKAPYFIMWLLQHGEEVADLPPKMIEKIAEIAANASIIVSSDKEVSEAVFIKDDWESFCKATINTPWLAHYPKLIAAGCSSFSRS